MIKGFLQGKIKTLAPRSRFVAGWMATMEEQGFLN